MTPSQKSYYFRTWSEVQRAMQWNSPEGREAESDCWGSPALHPVYAAIKGCADLLAGAAGQCRPTANHLRHACHVAAVGYDLSSRSMTNAQLDRVLALFHLLIDPDNLKAILAWSDEESGERRRQIYSIRKSAPPRYFEKIARDRFGETDLEKLSLMQLRQLALTLRLRRPADSTVAPKPQPTVSSPAP
jgi:hypothetical protein